LDVEEEKTTIELVTDLIQLTYLADDVHFLNAIGFCNQHESNIVPILDKNAQFMGVITSSNLLKTLGDFSGANEIGGIIVLEIERIHFSISEISRIVESNDCTILHLNTLTNPANGNLQITLHLNKKEIAAVVSTFQRFEYHVMHHFGSENYVDPSDTNYRNLMNYLQI
jgi:CBS-domain-containing membrane protein